MIPVIDERLNCLICLKLTSTYHRRRQKMDRKNIEKLKLFFRRENANEPHKD